MPTIQKIAKIEDAKPQKGVWFDYYGEVFVSVVPTTFRAHIRRKAQIEDGKHDNKMSLWHQQWQYEKIENSFGQSVGRAKTFEIAIDVEGERHIIDSVVENLAIEFQHSLGVSLEEMDSRFLAHRKKGFVPYLVLDLTEYPISEYLIFDSKLNRKLLKWRGCEYMKVGNFFADLSDFIIRLSARVNNNHLKMAKEYFLMNLLVLESVHDAAIKLEAERRKEVEIKVIEQRKTEELRLIEQEIRQKKAQVEQLEYERRVQLDKKRNSPDFKYFRKCLEDEQISPMIENMEHELIRFTSFEGVDDEGNLKKEYFYLSLESYFEISYVNVFKKKGWKMEFDHSRVIINRNGEGEHLFYIQYGKTEQIY